jgi:amphiphysin
MYFNAINGMLSHQINFSQAIAEIYKPISGRVSDPDSIVSEGNPEGIRACEEYEAIVKELQVTLEPELEMIETRIIAPADELLTIIKQIRKGVTKREHKQLDYDRHRSTLKKLQDKKDKSAKDDKAMYKAENDVEQATQEFNYFNDLLKDELPKLFHLEREFIKPLFQSFYYMQLNVFYTLHDRMQGCDIGYFDLTLGIEDAFEAKRGQVRELAEALSITKFKTKGQKRPPKYGPGAAAGRLGIEGKTSRLAIEEKSTSSHAGSRLSQSESADQPPPSYSSSVAATESNLGRANSTGASWGTIAKTKGGAPPPPKPKPKKFAGTTLTETATALYDYEAQAEGDLSFTTGDIIEIMQRSDNDNEWWTGKVHGSEGQFPGEFSKSQNLEILPLPLPEFLSQFPTISHNLEESDNANATVANYVQLN